MTPGTTAETVDAMSLEKIDRIIDVLRREAYRWTPVRRTSIPQKSGKLRPLGIPPWSDKLVQAVVRSLLEAYYEPQFSQHSHGFRPHRGCQTAFGDIMKHWSGVKWLIEGAITQCFDRINHEVLLSILGEKIHDNRFVRLMSNMLKAGDLEEWTYNATLSGTPQGGVSSPILSNLYLDLLDQLVEKVLRPAHNHGERRKPYPPYMALLRAARRHADKEESAQAQRLRQQAQQMPSRDPTAPDFRRLWYVRYADDFLLGFSGPREEAQEITSKWEVFRRDHLKLELSKEKTLITHARTEAARFLGYEIVTLDADDQHDHRGQRCINGAPGWKVPVDVIQAKCSRDMQQGKPIHRAERLADTDFSISTQDQAEYRGLVQYYLLAFNVHRLWRLHRVMEISLVMTLANKFKTKASQIYQKYRQSVATSHGTLKVLEVTVDRGKTPNPLVARFGGIELRGQKHATLEDQPKRVYSSLRSEVVQRLLAQKGELCASDEGPFQVHHVRKLADLDRPGQGAKPPWVKRMASRRRKTLVVCQRCHEEIHRERPQRRKKRV
jgi:group II intron reverse transcriptase/maturase